MAQIILTTTGWLAKKFTDILSNMQSALVAAYVLMLLVWYCSEYKLILCVFFNPNCKHTTFQLDHITS